MKNKIIYKANIFDEIPNAAKTVSVARQAHDLGRVGTRTQQQLLVEQPLHHQCPQALFSDDAKSES